MRNLSKNTPPLFFVDQGAVLGTGVVLSGDALRHAIAQRLTPGQIFRVIEKPVFGLAAHQATEIIEAEVIEASRKRLVGKVIHRYYVDAPSYALHLYPAILKGDKFDLVIVKATELGVTSITPVVTGRTIPRLEGEKKAARRVRWENLSIAAAEQSGRSTIPLIKEITSFEEAVNKPGGGKKLLAFEHKEFAGGVTEAIGSGREVSIFVGPEGGFEADEVELATDKGVVPVSLGPHILRAETASMAACAIVIEYLSRA